MSTARDAPDSSRFPSRRWSRRWTAGNNAAYARAASAASASRVAGSFEVFRRARASGPALARTDPSSGPDGIARSGGWPPGYLPAARSRTSYGLGRAGRGARHRWWPGPLWPGAGRRGVRHRWPGPPRLRATSCHRDQHPRGEA
jgi:hypothetical protein